ncbi:MAG: NUDIX domain-containing protein [Acetobacteraceae bacterium]|nr:NUDIX domain-containing protein [Acetobacteraceae bacterium]
MFARHAASLLLWREGPDGTEVLMGVRGAGHRFMPNRLVFPGGAVDKGDGLAAAASEPEAETLALLGRVARPRLARGLVMAAARELEEETGLSFGTPPRLAGIHYLCRAITPPSSPIRFNARFLVASAGLVEGVAADSRELGSVRFYPVSEALELELMEVTRAVLGRLVEFLASGGASDGGTRAVFAYRRRRWEPD